MASSWPVAQIRDLTVDFHGDRGWTRAVDGVSLEIGNGEALGEEPGLGLVSGLLPGLGLETGRGLAPGEGPTGSGPPKVTISVSLEQPAINRNVSNSRKILIGEN